MLDLLQPEASKSLMQLASIAPINKHTVTHGLAHLRAEEIYTYLPPRHPDTMAKPEMTMIIKQNEQYQLHATLTSCGNQHSLILSQLWPTALNPHKRQILQVLLSDAELKTFSAFLVNAVAA